MCLYCNNVFNQHTGIVDKASSIYTFCIKKSMRWPMIIIICHGLECEIEQFHSWVHIFKSELRLVSSHIVDQPDYFSHIIQQRIRYLCPTWKGLPLGKNIFL
jgi:hypothetical protein